MKNIATFVGLAAALLAPTAAQAQFGGLGKLVPSTLGGSPSAPAGDADGFLNGVMLSTKNVMIAAALLAQAVTDRNGLAGKKAEIDAIQGVQNVKELGAHQAALVSNLEILNQRSDLTSDMNEAYKSGNDQQKKVIGTAMLNLAIGIARNVQLSGQAASLTSGIARNPALVTRAGQFKSAGSLLALQAKGLAGIAIHLPALMAAVKVKAPESAESTQPKPIEL